MTLHLKKNFILLSFFYLSMVCFGQENDFTEKLTFSHKRGFYTENFDLTLSTTTPGFMIKYTKDGTNPLTSGSAKNGESPLTIRIDPSPAGDRDRAPGYCIRAVAVDHNSAVTKTKTHTFLFYERIVELSPDGVKPGPDWLNPKTDGDGQYINYGLDRGVTNSSTYRNRITPAFMDIPTISMVMNLKDLFGNGGIYVNAHSHGIEWERPCSIELLNPDASKGFQIDAGVRIRGGYSRSNRNLKHAFRYFFRKEYGEGKLKYPLFGDEGVAEFDKVDLRTSQNYSWSFGGSDLNTMNRDVFSRDTQRDMGRPYTRSRYYHLYINGTYWGLFQTQERSEASYGENYFGGMRDDYDVVKVAADQGYVVEATDGTLDTWRELWDIAKDGFASDENYYNVQGKNPDGTDNPDIPVLLDIDNLIDYTLITFITGNYDAPISNFINNQSPNNFYAMYNRNARDGFRFFQHDGEHTMRNHEWATDRTGPFPAGNTFEKSNPQWIHQQLTANPKYRARLADHIHAHYFNDGVLTPHKNIKRFLARKEEIDLAIIAESARWGDSMRSQAFNRDQHWLGAIQWIVEDFFPERTKMVLQQVINKGWYPMASPPVFNSKTARVDKGFQLAMNSNRGDVYYTTDGTDPFNPNVSMSDNKMLVEKNDLKRVLVPSKDPGSTWRSSVTYNDNSWMQGRGPVGYENNTGYESQIKINVGDQMVDGQTSCYIRIPFTVSKADIAGFNILQLKMLYDDGFVAWLNGWKMASSLAPDDLAWNAQAESNHEADAWETFNVNNALAHIKDGENLLAIHALNISPSSSDFIIDVELNAAQVTNTGAISESALIFDSPLNIEKTTHIKARSRVDQDWSAGTDITLYVFENLDNLKFTEIHYHPADEGDTSNDDGNYEFLELKNIGREALDLSGVHFRGIQFTFPANTTLGAGEHVVLAANSAAFLERYGFSPRGQYVGKLDNSGEMLALVNAADDTLTKIRYNDKFPWPRSADGGGYSIVPKNLDPYRDQNEGTHWVASSVIHGTPGQDDFVATRIEIKEETNSAPARFALYQNYPNPFNPTTTISFTLPKEARVQLRIFNVLGQMVETLVDAKLSSGDHAVRWNGSRHAAGVYLYHLQADGFSMTKKLTLVK